MEYHNDSNTGLTNILKFRLKEEFSVIKYALLVYVQDSLKLTA